MACEIIELRSSVPAVKNRDKFFGSQCVYAIKERHSRRCAFSGQYGLKQQIWRGPLNLLAQMKVTALSLLAYEIGRENV